MEKETIPDLPENETELLKEEWEEKVVVVEREKANLLFMKLAADEDRRRLQKEQEKLQALENQKSLEHMTAQKEHQKQLSEVQERNRELSSEIQRLKDQVAAKKRKSEELRRAFGLRKTIPETKVTFTRLETAAHGGADGNIGCCLSVSSKIPMKLNPGEALIAFEEENVAQELIQQQEHRVNLENGKTTILTAHPIALETGVAFKLYAQISLQRVVVSNIPDLSIPKEWMRDKLELHFLRLGSSEVQDANYDPSSQKAWVTFAQPQAAKDILRYNECPFRANGHAYRIQVTPSIQRMVEGFQMFSGVSRRTVLLTGIAEVEAKDEEIMQDLIAIHFQKPSNGGGEVEHVKCVSKGTETAYFEMAGVI